MKKNNNSIFTNAIIFLMALFVVLPCSLKQQLKQRVLISDVQHTVKPNANRTCQSFTKEKSRKNYDLNQKKELVKYSYNFNLPLFAVYKLPQNRFPFSEVKFAPTVPIYLLHEQYLI